MPLVNAKCTSCGAYLKVDDSKDAAVCEFCGAAYLVEKAINNYNIINNIEYSAKGEKEKERLLKNAKTNEKLKDYKKAYEIYRQVTEDYPDEYRGWLGKAAILTKNFTECDLKSDEFSDVSENIKSALIVAPEDVKPSINEKWDSYLEKHSEFIKNKTQNKHTLDTSEKELRSRVSDEKTKKSMLEAETEKLNLKYNKLIKKTGNAELVGGIISTIVIVVGILMGSALLIVLGALGLIGFIALAVFRSIRKKQYKKTIEENLKQIQVIDGAIKVLNEQVNEKNSEKNDISKRYKI